jgi:hypothetical protein
MPKQEPTLEFRLSSPNEFQCSFCRGDGIRKKGEGSFTVIGDLLELVAAFRAHVGHYHTEDANQPPRGGIPSNPHDAQ